MTQNEFIEKIGKIIKAENQKRGFPLFSSVVIAQAILETGWGRSNLMMKANALFGIKAFEDWKGKVFSSYTQEVYNNNSVSVQAKFRAYDKLEDSVADYFDLICKSSRYRQALTTESPFECITEIKNGGYATDPDYVSKIMSIINTWNLTIFDNKDVQECYTYQIGKNYTTQVDLNVRAGAGTNYRIKNYNELTEDGKKHAYRQENAVLKKGTTVTILEFIGENENIWFRIPSGYICGKWGDKVYVK